MLNLKKEVRDINRFNHIVFILGQEGFGYLFDKARIKGFFKRKEVRGEEKPKRLRRALERLGPTFIKLGQILSLRPDLLPKEYIRELGNLQDKVPPFPYKEVEKIIKEELGRPVDELFLKFSKNPIASASISQVHKAKLKSGSLAAVKVQRPKAKEIMETDIEIMFYIAKLLEKHSKKIGKFKPLRIVEEFKAWTEKEIDFRIEAENAKRFYKNFRGSEILKIPKVFDKYSTGRVLTTEFIEGVELHNISAVKGKKGYNIRKIMKNGFDVILTSVFIHGFFHADPHPGNILVLKGNRIALVDFGIVGYFDEELKRKSFELFYGIVEEDMDAIVDTFLDMGLVEEDETDIESFKRDIKKVIDPLQKSSLKDAKISYVLEEVLDIAFKYKVKMPVDFVLFGKAIVEVEGVGLEYEPDFRFVDSAKPFLEKLIKREITVMNMARNFKKNMARYGKLFRELPDQISAALRRIQKGTVKIDVEDTDVKRLGTEIDKSSNRLTYGMIVAAFLITGALLVNVGKPVLYGYSLVSIICFVMAFAFIMLLVVSIEREGRE